MWARLAQEYIMGEDVVYHTDSARAYDAAPDEESLHTKVVHQKKYRDGILIKPRYTELVTLKLPNGKKLQVVKGTQYVDGFWRILRSKLGGSHRSDDALINQRVRFAQWTQWISTQDEWVAFGSMLGEQK
eukprot:2938532-Amphidinium_carterae.1